MKTFIGIFILFNLVAVIALLFYIARHQQRGEQARQLEQQLESKEQSDDN